MDRNSYNSGDWFNRLDWTLQSNNFGVGLPPAVDNSSKSPQIQPRLANPALKPAAGDMEANFTHARELLKIRNSSPLFRLRTEGDIMARLQFLNTGPDQVPGLIVMSLSDKNSKLPDLDPAYEQIVVLFNASDTAQSFTIAGLASQGFRLHPVQANSADGVVRSATFDPATGVFSVPARTTAVFVQGETTQITIVKDARPDSKRSFHFSGDLGRFTLKDWDGRHGGDFPQSKAFSVNAGSYTVREDVPHDWWLLDVACDVAGRSQADLGKAQVRINVYPGDSVTCTFVNGASAAILGRVYFDRNADGKLSQHEDGMKGWQVTVYTAAGQMVKSDQTNGSGKSNTWELQPGVYKICSENRFGWWNTQPAVFDAALGNRPCYTVNAEPGSMTQAYFGFADKQPAVVRATVATAGLLTMPNPYLDNSEEGSSQPFVDPDADLPLLTEPMYLPLITR